MKRLFSLPVLISLLSSCIGHSGGRYITEDDLRWMYSLRKNDTTYFISNRGNRSMLHSVAYIAPASSADFFDEHDTRNMAYCYFDITQNEEKMEGHLAIYRINPGELAMCGKLGRRTGDLGPYLDLPYKPRQFVYNNMTFPVCYIMDSLNSDIPYGYRLTTHSDLAKMVVSKDHGLIYYSFANGEEYFRVFNDSTDKSLQKP